MAVYCWVVKLKGLLKVMLSSADGAVETRRLCVESAVYVVPGDPYESEKRGDGNCGESRVLSSIGWPWLIRDVVRESDDKESLEEG